MLTCGTYLKGSLHYTCTNSGCTHTKTLYLTCKSRLCNACGQKATERWITHQGHVLPDCAYRHLTFTMPDVFWVIFKLNRPLLGSLFAIAAEGLLSLAKKKQLTVGFFAALHTYGRSLNFNTHIHLSLAEYGINQHNDLKRFSFRFASIMPMWRWGVIRLLRQHYPDLVLPDSLTETIKDSSDWSRYLDQHYRRYWNVHIAKKTTHKNQTKNYIGRYLKKPPIAASRLKHIYGGDVTFEYLDHRDKQHKRLVVSQTEMMLRLLSHIPEKHFKLVRYYGFLSNRCRGVLLPIIYQKLGQKLALIKPLSFAAMMKSMMDVDPFECILCGSRMAFAYFEKGRPLLEMILRLKDIAQLRPI